MNNDQDVGAGSQSQPHVQPNDAGSMSKELAAAGKVVMSPSVKPLPPSLDIDVSEIDKAAQELGITRISGKKIRAHRVIGDALKRAGAIKVGRSNLLVVQENMNAAMEELDELSQGDFAMEKPSFRLAVLQTKVQLASAQAKAAYDFIRSAEVDQSDDAGAAQGFQPFAPRTPVGPVIKAEPGSTVNVMQKSS